MGDLFDTHCLICSSPAHNIQDLPFQIELFVQQVQSSAFAVAGNMLSGRLEQTNRQRGLSLLKVAIAGTVPGDTMAVSTAELQTPLLEPDCSL